MAPFFFALVSRVCVRCAGSGVPASRGGLDNAGDMTRWWLLLVPVVAATAAAASSGTQRHVPTVSCFEAIGHQRTGRGSGYRVVLDVVSTPPAFLAQVVSTHTTPWRYWRKAGLLVRMGSQEVTVSVPDAWRTRVAVTWASSGTVSALRIGHCPPPPTAWSAYAGGFYVHTPACVPLEFRVGRRTATVWFGVGRRCPASRVG